MTVSKVSLNDCSIATEKLMRFYSLESKTGNQTNSHFISPAKKNPSRNTPTKSEPIAKEKLLRFYGGIPSTMGSPSSLAKNSKRPVRAASDGSATVNQRSQKEKLMRFYGLQPMAQKACDNAEDDRDEVSFVGDGVRLCSPGKPGSFKRKILRASSSKF